MSASSLKYLLHDSAKLVPEQYVGEFFAKKARQQLQTSEASDQIGRIQTLCTLVLYEVHRGNGVQTWSEIGLDCFVAKKLLRLILFEAFTRSLIQLSEATQQITSEDMEDLEIAEMFLRLMELLHGVGNSLLRTSLYDYERGCWTKSHATRQLAHLLELQLRIQNFNDGRLGLSMQPHWHSNSAFRSLQSELDDYLLQQPDDLCLTRDMLHRWIDQGFIDRVHCALLWHCCVMVLNRVFLPIRTSSIKGSKFQEYPMAPKHFLVERENVCTASATTTPLMGYSCYHSSLLLLDRLHDSSGQDWTDAMQNLSINFAILGAMRSFYPPTELWIETLLKVQGHRIQSSQEGSSALFSHYFRRFRELKEPALIPIQAANQEVQAECDNWSRRLGENHNDTISAGETSLRSAIPQRTWLDEYQTILEEQMAGYATVDDESQNLAPLQRSDTDRTPNSIPSRPQDSLSHLALSPSANGQLPTTQDLTQCCDAGLQPEGHSTSTSLVATNVSLTEEVTHANVGSTGQAFPEHRFRGATHESAQGELTLHNTWIQPPLPEFSDDFDVESLLFEQLGQGESWVVTQRPACMGQWSLGAHFGMMS
ncbi:uncharacterized protein A1O5_04997 [Cladophialophora psammophila CBS 110553]|uniref:Transcription factor domain-containing protein n=1 Tax=Cladophialophora psammophila CBS 110553 TaxID=1182543 RepID=W9WWB2_9EURO|nr:uncharacterized protein A1O5_04997 [Cladophialophora psammophila CBS 110553]EXJ72492.1 hypothetical protein A1O5_04997 [Cladophialophora psammophila CBS 110553]